jgi:hypothetical protein
MSAQFSRGARDLGDLDAQIGAINTRTRCALADGPDLPPRPCHCARDRAARDRKAAVDRAYLGYLNTKYGALYGL